MYQILTLIFASEKKKVLCNRKYSSYEPTDIYAIILIEILSDLV